LNEPIKRGSRPLTKETIRRALQNVPREIRKVGDGSAVFSPTTELDRQPIRWDTNCFYRRLGLETSATRLDVARRFLELDPRQDFIRLATAAGVLLSRQARPRYDALTLGTFWSDDPELMQSKISGDLGPTDREWGVYADMSVTDEEAKQVDPRWRAMFAAEFNGRFPDLSILPHVGVGATCSGGRHRWEQVGIYAVFFVPVDSEPTLEYVHSAVEELFEIAEPIPI
jgi:hypothetical protein